MGHLGPAPGWDLGPGCMRMPAGGGLGPGPMGASRGWDLAVCTCGWVLVGGWPKAGPRPGPVAAGGPLIPLDQDELHILDDYLPSLILTIPASIMVMGLCVLFSKHLLVTTLIGIS